MIRAPRAVSTALAATMAIALAMALAGCAPSEPETAGEALDRLEDAGLTTCRERREPVPGVITCEDDEAGDLTVGIVDDPLTTVRATAKTTSGPWVVGDSFVIITYDDDADRAQAIADELGAAEVYTVAEDGEPEPLDG